MREKQIAKVDTYARRSSRLRNRFFTVTPLHQWAHWIVESKLFSTIYILAIVLNAIVIGIQLGKALT